jgi:hypothetical protein
MGIIRDILDTVKDVSSMSTDTMSSTLRRRKYSSISRQSLEGTLQFPVLVSKSLDIDTLQMMTKALERQYASFVQVSLTMNPVLNLQNDRDAIGYLRKFHQNSNVKTSLGDVVGAGMSLLKENYEGYTDDLQQSFLFAAVYEGSTSTLVAANKEQLQTILEGVREDVLNDKFVPRNPLYRFKNDNLAQYHNSIVTEGKSGKDRHKDKRGGRGGRDTEGWAPEDSTTPEVIVNDFKWSDDVHKYGMGGGPKGGSTPTETPKTSPEKDKPKGEPTEKARVTSKPASEPKRQESQDKPEKHDYTLPNNILKDNDAKKANELVPTTMHVRTILVNKEGANQGTMDFIIGIKTTMHPVSSDEMVSNLLTAVKSKSGFFNSIRWTSGEISFFKDFLFNVGEIKEDVSNRSAGASHWWIALKRRRALAKTKKAMMLPNHILPNASIVLSMEEVEFIKSQYGYDLMNPMFVSKIMDTYFLLGFAVVDNSTQIAHFLFDGHEGFQSVSFTGLERDAKGSGSTDLKDVLKLVQRI